MTVAISRASTALLAQKIIQTWGGGKGKGKGEARLLLLDLLTCNTFLYSEVIGENNWDQL